MLLTHMQATNISHMCGLHICVLLCTVHAIYAAALCSWVANRVLSSFILSSYRVSFGQLGRDSLRDKEKEIELCTDEFLGHTEKLVVHTPYTCSCL